MSATSSGVANDAEHDERARDEREQRRDRARDARGLLPFLSRDQRGIDRE